jgi:hypothetical protein
MYSLKLQETGHFFLQPGRVGIRKPLRKNHNVPAKPLYTRMRLKTEDCFGDFLGFLAWYPHSDFLGDILPFSIAVMMSSALMMIRLRGLIW